MDDWNTHARRFDAWLPVLLTLVGAFGGRFWVFLDSVAWTFVLLAGTVLAAAACFQLWADEHGDRIQGPRRGNGKVVAEAFETARAMYVIATLAAWPITMIRTGQPTGLVWTLEEAGGSLFLVLAQFAFGVVVIDAWTYWKHRLLHTRRFFVFHKAHHTFRDPTTFAGFAVGPVETVLTFAPLLALCVPWATHYAPVYFALIGSFVVLNLYLHCGVTTPWAERWLARVGLNSSAWHNLHHAKVGVHFGEVSPLWDWLCATHDDTARSDLVVPAK
jgi:lathosterol oxidase